MHTATQVQTSRPTESVPTSTFRLRYLNVRHWLVCLALVVCLPMLLPVGLMISLFIKLDSRGSVLFAQQRVGLYGRSFTMYKFRTMISGTQMHFKLTDEGDTRITRVGRVLRATHLDELPQIWNILRGEMDLIGPRPVPLQLYTFYQELIPDYDKRHALRPGIIGLAQVHLGYTTTLEEEKRKWAYDVAYVTKADIVTDIHILVRTMYLLFTCRKVSAPNTTSPNVTFDK